MASSSVPTAKKHHGYSAKQAFVWNCSQEVHILHDIEHALSMWTLDDNHFTQIITALSRVQQMCLLTVTQVSSPFMYLWLLSGWSSVQTPGITTVIVQRGTPPKTLSLVCRSCTTDWLTPLMYQMTLCWQHTHKHLTQPLHGLVQDLSICTGIEVSAGFHSSSAGLRHGKHGQRRIIPV